MGGGFLDDGLDPMAGLAEERAATHAVPGCPALQHFRVGVQPSHQKRLALGHRISQLDEEAHAITPQWPKPEGLSSLTGSH